jgi:hypothetical protein
MHKNTNLKESMKSSRFELVESPTRNPSRGNICPMSAKLTMQ